MKVQLSSVAYKPTKFKVDQSKRVKVGEINPKSSQRSLDFTVFMVFSQTLTMTRADWLMIRLRQKQGPRTKKLSARLDHILKNGNID